MLQPLLRSFAPWFVVSAAAVLVCAPARPQQPASSAASAASSEPGGMIPESQTEDQLRQMFVGKTFYLRGGYLDDNLGFNEHGALIGHSPQGSYTLNLVEIDRIRLTKHKVELEGVRYGLHFLGALPYEDPASAFDRVRITPKKKTLRITIDRELVVKPKKEKPQKPNKLSAAAQAAVPSSNATAHSAPGPAQPDDADNLKAAIAAAPAAERPADPASVTTTTSPQHAAKTLNDALQNIFAANLDASMVAAMPEFWKLYYQAQAAKTDFRPADPAVLRQDTVNQKARLLTSFEPDSNEYAQQNGVAGMALYHVVVGAEGKPLEIAVARPIGFGLDENAVSAIRNAHFDPAMKDGKPVPVLLDLVVEFRIYSKRTGARAVTENSAAATAPPADKQETAPTLPGPYSVHPAQ